MKRNSLFYFLIYLSCWLLIGATTTAVDPTRPPTVNNKTANAVPTRTAALTLSAVFIYPDSKIAIINNQPLKVGDHINEYIITGISLNTVELTGPRNNREVLELTTQVKQDQPQGRNQ